MPVGTPPAGFGFRVPSPNTVDLSCENGDGVVRRLGWLGPVVVFGALDAPVGHLALDDAGVGTCAARREWLGEDLCDRAVMCGVEAVGGKIPDGIWCCGGWRGGFW
jgi:hypothetical protein